MSDKLTAIKIKQPDGTYSDQILISVLADNVRYNQTMGLKDKIIEIEDSIGRIIAAPSGSTDLDRQIIQARGNQETLGLAIRRGDQKALNTVLVQSNQPTAAQNKLWVQKTNNDEVKILSAQDFANEYDNTIIYSINDYVIYGNTLYKCKINIDTAEDWTPSHWEQITLGNELNGIKNTLLISTNNEFLNPYKDGYYYISITGSTNEITPRSSVNYDSWCIPCSEGDDFTINIYSANGTHSRGYAFIRSNMTAIDYTLTLGGELKDLYLVAPEETAYLLVNHNKTNSSMNDYVVRGKLIKNLKNDINEIQFTQQTIENNINEIQSIQSNMENSVEEIQSTQSTIETNINNLQSEVFTDTNSNEELLNFLKTSISTDFLIFYPGVYGTDAVGGVSSGIQQSEYTKYASINCAAGDKFTINLYGGSGAGRAWAFLDQNGIVLSRSSDINKINKGIIVAPSNAVTAIFNNRIFEYPFGYYVLPGNKDFPITSYHKLIPITVKDGSYWNSEGTSAIATTYASYRRYEPIPVKSGDNYIIDIYSATSNKQKPIVFTDDNFLIIEKIQGVSDIRNILHITVPEGATQMLLSTAATYSTFVYHHRPIIETITSLNSATFDFKGTNIAIIGDSISTNGDYDPLHPERLGNVPEIIISQQDIDNHVTLSAYVTYYDVGTTIGNHTISESEVGTEIIVAPITGDVGKVIGKPLNNNPSRTTTWWEVAAEILKFNPIPVCWSGSSITAHEENATENNHYIYKCAHAWHESQIRKCGIRINGESGNVQNRIAPDVVIIYRGTNDLSHSPYSKITDELDSFPTNYPDTDTFMNGNTVNYSYISGMRLLIKKLREAYPETKIVLCTLNYFRRLSNTNKYTDNGTDNWLKYNDMIRKLADYEGCDLIDFAKDGLTWANAANGYYNEGTSTTASWTHPNTTGQIIMGNKAIKDLLKMNDK